MMTTLVLIRRTVMMNQLYSAKYSLKVKKTFGRSKDFAFGTRKFISELTKSHSLTLPCGADYRRQFNITHQFNSNVLQIISSLDGFRPTF